MTLHAELSRLEREFDRFEDQLVARHGEAARSPMAPPRADSVPPDVLLVGLVGGTGVGKSTLVNALAEADISRASRRRPTTDRIVPYIHTSKLHLLDRLDFLKDNLTTDIKAHEVAGLENVILFDLPDIDSNEEGHGRVVQAALEGLDIVTWVTSLTKYSDRVFHDWIKKHASGRDVGNFIFYLNKIDELDPKDGPAAAGEVMKLFRGAVAESLATNSGLGEAQFFSGSAGRPQAKIPGNQVEALRAEIFRERDLREIERIKSSDRLALLANRLHHVERTLDLEGRLAVLQRDMAEESDRFAEVAREPALKKEFGEQLVHSSAVDEAAKPIMKKMLASWPLLPKLSILALPLRQLSRLGKLPALLIPGSDDDDGPSLRLLRSRLLELDLERREAHSRRLDADDAVRPALDAEEIRGFVSALENEAVAEVRNQAREEMESTPPVSGPTRLLRHVAVWSPLVWFPVLQPILSDILDPEKSQISLPARLTYRLVRILGAGHLLVSAAFVIAVYVVYVLMIKMAARRRALKSCRALNDGRWWVTTVEERLAALFLSPARSRLMGLEAELDNFRYFKDGLAKIRHEVGA